MPINAQLFIDDGKAAFLLLNYERREKHKPTAIRL